MKILRLMCLAAVGLLAASGANASLIGDTVSHHRDASLCCSQITGAQTLVIAPGGTTFTASLHNVFVDSNSITLIGTNTGGQWYSGSTLADQFSDIFDLDWVGTTGFITGINVTVTGDLGLQDGLAFDPLNDVSFTADSVQVRLAGFEFLVGSSIRVDLVTSHNVPEPATLALFGLGLSGLGFAVRRRKTH